MIEIPANAKGVMSDLIYHIPFRSFDRTTLLNFQSVDKKLYSTIQTVWEERARYIPCLSLEPSVQIPKDITQIFEIKILSVLAKLDGIIIWRPSQIHPINNFIDQLNIGKVKIEKKIKQNVEKIRHPVGGWFWVSKGFLKGTEGMTCENMQKRITEMMGIFNFNFQMPTIVDYYYCFYAAEQCGIPLCKRNKFIVCSNALNILVSYNASIGGMHFKEKSKLSYTSVNLAIGSDSNTKFYKIGSKEPKLKVIFHKDNDTNIFGTAAMVRLEEIA